MSDFWLDIWQQLTGKVCLCKHTKRHHIKLGKDFANRSDVQCLDWVFNGGGFGERSTLGCCQCLSYHQRNKYYFHLIRYIRCFFIKPKPFPTPKEIKCVCGHTAYEHGIGVPSRPLNPIYPPCDICKCREYDCEFNPKIGNTIQRESNGK